MTLSWYSLVLEHPQIEEYAHVLFEGEIPELQVVGVQIISQNQASAFVHASDAALAQLPATLSQHQMQLVECKQLKDHELAPHPAEVYEPLQIGTLRINPVQELPSTSSGGNSTEHTNIVIVPGTGFGTGHHATTKMVLSLLQTEPFRVRAPSRSLDLGCGSALLALATAALHGGSIDAVDNDPLALENAQLNLQGNPALAGQIALYLREEWRPQKYQLLLANLYSSLLHESAQLLTQSADKEAVLAISGFTEDEAPALRIRFAGEGWQLLENRSCENWCAAAFRLR